MSTVLIERKGAKTVPDTTPPRRKSGRPRQPDQPIQPLRRRPGPKPGAAADAPRETAKRAFLLDYFHEAGLLRSYRQAMDDWASMKDAEDVSNWLYYTVRKGLCDAAAARPFDPVAATVPVIRDEEEDDVPGPDDGDGPDERGQGRLAARVAHTAEGLENLIDHAIEAVIYAVAGGTLDEVRGGVARRRLRQARRALYGRELEG